MNQIDLQNQCAVNTGGVQVIGLAIAERFLASETVICLWDRDEPLVREIANALTPKDNVESAVMSITDLNSVKNVVQQTKKALGLIDILFYNTGITRLTIKLWEYPPEDWQQVIDIDLTGIFNYFYVVSPLLIEQNYGRIVNVTPSTGKDGNSYATPYNAVKARVVDLDQVSRKGYLLGYNIAVDCITLAAAKTQIF